MTTRHSNREAPHLLHSAAEMRALFEMALLPYALPALLAAPRGAVSSAGRAYGRSAISNSARISVAECRRCGASRCECRVVIE